MNRPPAAVVFGPMRLPFLLLTPACLAVGVASAWRDGAVLEPLALVLVLVGGVAAHVAVNALNEFHDARSGLDATTTPTPFSGGSQALPRHPGWEPVALATGLAALAVVAAAGIVLTLRVGLGLLASGLAGVVLITSYTPIVTRLPWLCLAAPGLGFGTVMVLGAAYAVAGDISPTAVLASFVPFFLVSNLLLLNQFPDREPDRRVGRRHLVITAGPRLAARVYSAQLALAYLTVLVGWLAAGWSAWTLLAWATVPLAVAAARRAARHPESLPELVPALAQNVLVNLLTPALLALGLFLGGRATA
jgi:1,4-dihydroxy-2-naphthoate octaprenyltransferase